MGCLRLTYCKIEPTLKVAYKNLKISSKSCAGNYRYGYQGSEGDDEVKGDGNSYTTEFRMLDPRLGRWLSLDPKAAEFPWMSPYVSMADNPILNNDVNGDIPWPQVLAYFSKVTSEQGDRVDPFTGAKNKGHGGMDIAAPIGTDVKAMADGEVVLIKWDAKKVEGHVRGYGRYVVIKHADGYYTLYGHLEKDGVQVVEGQKVTNGQVIATSGNTGGSTGPHLHLEVVKSKNLSGVFKYKNKLNPREVGDLQVFINSGGGDLGEQPIECKELEEIKVVGKRFIGPMVKPAEPIDLKIEPRVIEEQPNENENGNGQN